MQDGGLIGQHDFGRQDGCPWNGWLMMFEVEGQGWTGGYQLNSYIQVQENLPLTYPAFFELQLRDLLLFSQP